MLPEWTLAPVVAALQTMRGMALVNAATLIAELGDLLCNDNCDVRPATIRLAGFGDGLSPRRQADDN